MALAQVQTGRKNRVQVILHRHGLFPAVVKLFGMAGRRWLQRLLGAPCPPPASARDAWQGYLQLLHQLRRQIVRVTRTLRRQVQDGPPARRLCALPGVQWILGYTLRAEIGDIGRIRSARHLASYSLLAPRAFDSGEPDDDPPRGRHVGHQGRRTLKWAYIEAAHGAVWKSSALRAWFDHYTHGRRQNCNRGYIGVARRLCHYSYVVGKNEVPDQAEPPPRPGSRRQRSRLARLVKGQPVDALAAVADR